MEFMSIDYTNLGKELLKCKELIEEKDNLIKSKDDLIKMSNQSINLLNSKVEQLEKENANLKNRLHEVGEAGSETAKSKTYLDIGINEFRKFLDNNKLDKEQLDLLNYSAGYAEAYNHISSYFDSVVLPKDYNKKE